MGRIEEIKRRLESEFYVFTEEHHSYGGITEFREAYEDVAYLLSRLQIAEEALTAFDRVLHFDVEELTYGLEIGMKNALSGTEVSIFNEQIERVKMLNHAKKLGKQALEQILEDEKK